MRPRCARGCSGCGASGRLCIRVFRAAAPLQDEIELLERCEALVARAEELASHLAAARNSVAQLRRGERMNGAPADILQ